MDRTLSSPPHASTPSSAPVHHHGDGRGNIVGGGGGVGGGSPFLDSLLGNPKSSISFPRISTASDHPVASYGPSSVSYTIKDITGHGLVKQEPINSSPTAASAPHHHHDSTSISIDDASSTSTAASSVAAFTSSSSPAAPLSSSIASNMASSCSCGMRCPAGDYCTVVLLRKEIDRLRNELRTQEALINDLAARQTVPDAHPHAPRPPQPASGGYLSLVSGDDVPTTAGPVIPAFPSMFSPEAETDWHVETVHSSSSDLEEGTLDVGIASPTFGDLDEMSSEPSKPASFSVVGHIPPSIVDPFTNYGTPSHFTPPRDPLHILLSSPLSHLPGAGGGGGLLMEGSSPLDLNLRAQDVFPQTNLSSLAALSSPSSTTSPFAHGQSSNAGSYLSLGPPSSSSPSTTTTTTTTTTTSSSSSSKSSTLRAMTDRIKPPETATTATTNGRHPIAHQQGYGGSAFMHTHGRDSSAVADDVRRSVAQHATVSSATGHQTSAPPSVKSTGQQHHGGRHRFMPNQQQRAGFATTAATTHQMYNVDKAEFLAAARGRGLHTSPSVTQKDGLLHSMANAQNPLETLKNYMVEISRNNRGKVNGFLYVLVVWQSLPHLPAKYHNCCNIETNPPAVAEILRGASLEEARLLQDTLEDLPQADISLKVPHETREAFFKLISCHLKINRKRPARKTIQENLSKAFDPVPNRMYWWEDSRDFTGALKRTFAGKSREPKTKRGKDVVKYRRYPVADVQALKGALHDVSTHISPPHPPAPAPGRSAMGSASASARGPAQHVARGDPSVGRVEYTAKGSMAPMGYSGASMARGPRPSTTAPREAKHAASVIPSPGAQQRRHFAAPVAEGHLHAPSSTTLQPAPESAFTLPSSSQPPQSSAALSMPHLGGPMLRPAPPASKRPRTQNSSPSASWPEHPSPTMHSPAHADGESGIAVYRLYSRQGSEAVPYLLHMRASFVRVLNEKLSRHDVQLVFPTTRTYEAIQVNGTRATLVVGTWVSSTDLKLFRAYLNEDFLVFVRNFLSEHHYNEFETNEMSVKSHERSLLQYECEQLLMMAPT